MSASPVLSLDCFAPVKTDSISESEYREWNRIKGYTVGDLSGWEE
jgi:hypothetical protein